MENIKQDLINQHQTPLTEVDHIRDTDQPKEEEKSEEKQDPHAKIKQNKYLDKLLYEAQVYKER